MRPFVGFAEADEEDPRMVVLQALEDRALQEVVVAQSASSSTSPASRAFGKGTSHPLRTGIPARGSLKIASKTSHVPHTRTFPANPRRRANHSYTVTLGLGPKAFLSMSGSAAPVSISL